MALSFILSGCSSSTLKDYNDEKPLMSPQEYFNGPIKAWGLIQDRSGKVIRRFDVDMVGSWDSNTGTLEEEFRYYDGPVEHRTWTITRKGEGHYEGRADDIIGTAQGETAGNAMRWAYQMDIETGGRTFRIDFDDWMYLMNDGVLINRSYLKKFGFTVAELTLFMQKQDQ